MFPFLLGLFPNWSWFWLFVVFFLFRYVRLWGNLIAIWRYRPIMPPDDPTITSKDVTVIIPTLAENTEQLKETLRTAYELEPAALLLVTPDASYKRVSQMVDELHESKRVRVLSVSRANKRRQLSRAIPEVETEITLLLDDDVWLPKNFAKWVLAPFEDPQMGGVGTNQIVKRVDRSNIWEFLGAIYLVRRTFDCTACNWMDGGLPCLSGRAVAYRSKILQDKNFTDGFTHEKWGAEHFLNADDDNFITRWLFSHDWKIQLQNHRECEVETTLENNHKYLRQCLRWVRSNWRSNLTSLLERHMWKKYPWSMYAVFTTTVTQWAVAFDFLLAYTFCKALCEAGYYEDPLSEDSWQPSLFWSMFLGHWLFSKTVKLVPHLLRNPGDVRFVPVSVLFGYFHNLIKLYGGFTVHKTTWGTREGADTDNNLRMMPISTMSTISPSITPPMTPKSQGLRERGALVPTAVS